MGTQNGEDLPGTLARHSDGLETKDSLFSLGKVRTE